MIKEKTVKIIGHPRNLKYYQELGYELKVGEFCEVNVKDLKRGSYIKLVTICDVCGSESSNFFKDYYNYTNGLKEKFYCNKCNKEKASRTSLERWGVSNPMKSDKVKQILKNSIIEKFGVEYYSQTEEWKEKFKSTSLERWGEDNPSKSREIITKIKHLNTEKLKSKEFREISKQTKQRNTWKKYEKLIPSEYTSLSYSDSIFKIKHNHSCEFEITKSLLSNRIMSNSIICTICNPIEIQISSFEIEVGNFLEDCGVKIEKKNRKILEGLELDYYLEDFNLAIECNGVFWHNELFKSKKYHLEKTLKCNKMGISLLHIWEDDWKNKKDIIKSIILNKIGKIPNRIFARKCEIKTVETQEYRKFLEKNHIQGFASSSYNIGLYYDDELISLMTFGWRRTNNKREYELIRFCNKINHNVIGSASKLFNYFLKNINLNVDIVSWADISLFSGDLYGRLGFELGKLSEPNYFWVVDGVRKHRYNFSKRKLVNSGFEKDLTEVEIMNKRGYYRIFSTGQQKWIYKIKKNQTL